MAKLLAAQVGHSINHFGLDFLSQTNIGNNAVFSPLSLVTALYIVHLGTQKNSKSAGELSTILDYNQLKLNLDEPHQGLATVYKYMQSTGRQNDDQNEKMDFNVANLLLSNKQTTGPLKQEFKQTLDEYYKIKLAQFNRKVNSSKGATSVPKDVLLADGSGLIEFDVGNKREIADCVNEWVSKKTNKKIENLLDESSLPELQDLTTVLVNAVYLKAKWGHFTMHDTQNNLFFNYGDEGQVKRVPLMRTNDASAKYYSSSAAIIRGTDKILGSIGFQALELAYKGEGDKAISLVVMLPDKINGLAELEEALTPLRLLEIYRSLKKKKVNVVLPKFKFEQEYNVEEILIKLGVKKMFTIEANLTEMYEFTNRQIAISKVAHKAVIEVNESGVEAAAATGITITLLSYIPPEQIPSFRADHPFLFVVRHVKTNASLFIGRVTHL